MVWISLGLQGRSNPEHHGQASDRVTVEDLHFGVCAGQPGRPPTAVLVIIPPGLEKVEHFLFYKSLDSGGSTSHLAGGHPFHV